MLHVLWVSHRLMNNRVMSGLNRKGNRGKTAFEGTRLCNIVVGKGKEIVLTIIAKYIFKSQVVMLVIILFAFLLWTKLWLFMYWNAQTNRL